jgi:hypothetical protein
MHKLYEPVVASYLKKRASLEGRWAVDRAELGALRDAIDTILSWPDSVRDQIAQWLQMDRSKPNGADPGQLSHSRSNRHHGFKPSAEESATRERALLEAMRAHPEAGAVHLAKAARCDKSSVSMRLGRLAKRGLVERDGNGRWRLAVGNPTMRPSL